MERADRDKSLLRVQLDYDLDQVPRPWYRRESKVESRVGLA